jgi:Protein of unknown function (DUF2971)
MNTALHVNSEIENTCYKYYKISRYLIEAIVRPSIYYSKPEELNDPHDCQLNLNALLKDPRLSTDNRFTKIKDELGKINSSTNICSGHGIFCTTKLTPNDKNETLMWSHYGDSHKGVRLKYNHKLILESFKSHPILMHAEVFYDKENDFITNLIDSNKEGYEFYCEFFNRFLTTKNPAWEYENEYRYVLPYSGGFEISTECVEEICFGLNTSQKDVELIVNLAKKYTSCKIFKQKKRGDDIFNIVDSEIYE